MSCTFPPQLKDPDAVLRHSFDWRPWLQEGETITDRAVTAEPGLTVDQDTVASGIVSYRVTGGEAGRDYRVTCEIATSESRIDQRSVIYRVRER